VPFLEELFVLHEEVLHVLTVPLNRLVELHLEAGDLPTNNGEPKSAAQLLELVATLLALGPALTKLGEDLGDVLAVLRFSLALLGNLTTDTAHHTRQTVQVVDAAGVVNAALALQEGLDVDVANDTDSTLDESNDQLTVGTDHQILTGTDLDTTLQSLVLDVDHVQLVLGPQQPGNQKLLDAGVGQREDGVDDDTVLGLAILELTVERGPVHPQEESTNHLEHV